MQKSEIYYCKKSENLEREYENYSWKIWQSIQMDVPEDMSDDHILDASKYVIVWYSRTRRLN